MKTYETVVPFFPGFYNSILDDMIDREVEYELEKNEKTYEEIEDTLDYHKARLEISKQWLNRFNIETGLNLSFKEIDSPREYNFSTDRLIVEISEDELVKVVDSCKENLGIFEDVLEELYTSRSGFIPFYSNDLDDWDKENDELDHNEIMTYLMAYVLISMNEEELLDSIHDYSSVYEAAQHVWK